MYASDIAIRPQQGWANVQLGSTISEVRAALATNGHAYELADDELTIDIHTPKVSFFFDASEPKRLVQIVFSDPEHRIDDQPVIGLHLAEALLPLRPQSFDDTLWSLISIDEEYPNGQPLADSERIRQSSGEQNLDCATLWVLSQDVGLVMLDGLVHEVAIRQAGAAPKVGCGHLNSRTMEMAFNVKPAIKKVESVYPESLRMPPPIRIPSARRAFHSVWIRMALTMLAITCVVVPAWIVYRELTAWRNSIAVVGTVVETKFEGPFLEEVVVEYAANSESAIHRVTIPSTYTTSQEIGNQVDLLYLVDKPHRAMTRIQILDEGWSVSPLMLFGSIGLATLFLHLAFPNHIRLGSRKRIN